MNKDLEINENGIKNNNFLLEDEYYVYDSEGLKLLIYADIFDNETVEYANKIIFHYLKNKNDILNEILDYGLREYYNTNFEYTDEYIKNNIGNPKIIINYKKDNNHQEWNFNYSGSIDYCDSNLDNHIISVDFKDNLIIKNNVRIDG